MYYLLIVQNDSIPAVYKHETKEAVLAAFHQEMAYRHESRYSTVCAILDEKLSVIRQEEYHAPVPEPNAEPTEGE